MPVKMSPHQLAFWRELLAPFPDEQLSETTRGGKKLTYVDKRAITNRLDSVCGPHGWYPEYEATQRGYKCRLYISVPMSTADTFVFMHKEDGAGFEEMGSYNKQTNEWEADVDNDEKSGYTNALRRAAQDAWGIGRYLYRKGIPTFLDPNAVAGHAATLPPVQAGPSPSAPPVELADRQAPPPSTREPALDNRPAPASAPAPAPAASGQQYDNFKIPKPGTSVFAWGKEMEKVFETKLLDGMMREAEEQGWGKVLRDWNEQQVNSICLGAIKFIRELPSYKGQFEHLFPGGCPDPKIATTKGSGPNTPPPAPGVNVADLRKQLMVRMQALVTRQTGQPADNAGLKAVFQAVAAAAKNGQGHAGEVPESLGKLTDVTWVTNMIALVDEQIAASAAPAEAGDPDIPF